MDMELCLNKEAVKAYTHSQRISMMRILWDIILADGKIDEREEKLFSNIAEFLELNESHRDEIKSANSLLALCDIRDFADAQKEFFAKVMGQMIIIDNDINYNEVRMYNVVNEFCNMNTEFEIDAYPDLSHS